jgi:hypothetical protein
MVYRSRGDTRPPGEPSVLVKATCNFHYVRSANYQSPEYTEFRDRTVQG